MSSTVTNPNTTVKSSSNLSELARNHFNSIGPSSSTTSKLFLPPLKSGLKTNNLPGLGFKLVIPKLNTSSIEATTEKLNNLIIQNSPITKIDLSNAILQQKDKGIVLKENLTPENIEPKMDFTPKFIDCEVLPLLQKLNLQDINCQIDSKYLLKEKIKLKTVKKSNFGKIVCNQFRIRNPQVLQIKHVFLMTNENSIEEFSFSSPSPDDVVLKQLKLKK